MKRLFLLFTVVTGIILGRVARADDVPAIPSITVVGEGEVLAAPDQAMVTLGVTTEGKTAAEALQANTAKMSELLAALKTHQIDDKHIQTSQFNVGPQHNFDRTGQQPPKIIGYTVTNQVAVKVLDVKRLGTILDAAVQAGGNQIQAINFLVSEAGALRKQARQKAIADARQRAETFADESNVKLGKTLRIVEATTSLPQPMYAQAMRGVASADVPIAVGEQSITAQVTVTYSLVE